MAVKNNSRCGDPLPGSGDPLLRPVPESRRLIRQSWRIVQPHRKLSCRLTAKRLKKTCWG